MTLTRALQGSIPTNHPSADRIMHRERSCDGRQQLYASTPSHNCCSRGAATYRCPIRDATSSYVSLPACCDVSQAQVRRHIQAGAGR